jgi:hypothetical protein
VQCRLAICDPTRWEERTLALHVTCFSNAVLLADLASVSLHRLSSDLTLSLSVKLEAYQIKIGCSSPDVRSTVLCIP